MKRRDCAIHLMEEDMQWKWSGVKSITNHAMPFIHSYIHSLFFVSWSQAKNIHILGDERRKNFFIIVSISLLDPLDQMGVVLKFIRPLCIPLVVK